MTQETADGVPISDGFDYPVGPRGADVDVFKTHKIDTVLADPNYFKSLGSWHPGEDWNGRSGGDTDLGEPIYAIANGKVIRFGHYPVWGNVVLLEHALPDNTRVWSQYAHLDRIMVEQTGQKVQRGQQIGTMGKGDNNRYVAHLHFEIRKNALPIDHWSPTVKDRNAVLANYYSPSDFIQNHRPGSFTVPEDRPAAEPKPEPAVSPATTARPAATARPAPRTRIIQVVLDTQQTNPQAGKFLAAQSTPWGQAANGFHNDMLWAPASAQQATHQGEWRPALPAEGVWEVWAFIPPNNATTTYARYQINHLDGETEIPVNQGGNRNRWIILGAFRFGPGQGFVRLTNVTGELTQTSPPAVGFDAICWTTTA